MKSKTGKRRWTPEREAELVRLISDGATYAQAAARFGVSPGAVNMKVGNLRRKGKCPPGPRQRPPLWKQRIARIIEMREAGKSDNEIASALGISLPTMWATIRHAKDRHGVTVPPANRQLVWTEARDAELARLVIMGATNAEAAKNLGASLSSIACRKKILRERGDIPDVDLRRREHRRPRHHKRHSTNHAADARAEKQPPRRLLAVFAPAANPEARLLPLIDLGPGDCRWPIDTKEGSRFCARPARKGTSWCDHHHDIAYERKGS